MYRVFSAILSPFSFLVPSFLSRLLGRLLQQRTRPARRVLPPADNAQRFIREFSEEYGESEIPFAESGFNLTLDNAKRDLQFLLVVLLSPNHDDNHTWVRETLLSSQVKAFLHSHRDELVLWGGNVQDAEAYQVASGLQCTKFPFAALICYTTESGPPGMTVVMRAVGPMSASELVAKLGTAMTAHQAPLRVAQAQRAEHQAARNLRQEQDSAYERSLAQDRERARRRREEQEAQARAEKEAQERAEAQELRKTNLEQWKRWRAQSLPSEPGPDVSDTIRVSIRLPSGERVIRKFRTDADLEEVYAFVECYEILRSNEDLSTSEVNEPANFEHAYGFQLVSPMPRTVYDVEKGGSIGDRVGRGANLIVEPVEEEGDETEDDGIR